MASPLFIGIAGPSGAGKTTLAKHIVSRYPHITHIKLDDFFKDVSEFPYYKHWLNREIPDNLHWDEFFAALANLRSGRETRVPIYDRKNGVRAGFASVTPSDVVLIEGYLLYFDPRVRDLIDVRLFLNASIEEQYRRKKERWPEMDDQYFFEVGVPAFEMHGSHGARHAHAILDGDQDEASIVAEFTASPLIQQVLK